MRRLTFISENGKMIPRLADGRRGICLYRKLNQPADMAELADAPDLGSGVPDVQVQVLLSAA